MATTPTSVIVEVSFRVARGNGSVSRAILKNPPILILDEATSALDTESRTSGTGSVGTSDENSYDDCNSPSAFYNKNADEICVLYEGEIVERGKHEELLALNGYYKRLNDMQSL